jgi:hypothetical protein
MMATNGKNNTRGATPGTRSDRVVEAKAFRLTDDDGNVRAELALNYAGQPSLRLMDGRGQIRIAVELGCGDQPEVSLYDGSGVCRVEVGTAVGVDKCTGVTVNDFRGGVRAELIVSDVDDAPCVYLSDEQARRVVVTLDPHHGPGVKLLDADGNEMLSAKLSADLGEAVLTLEDADGQAARITPTSVVLERSVAAFQADEEEGTEAKESRRGGRGRGGREDNREAP